MTDTKSLKVVALEDGGHRVVLDLTPWDKVGVGRALEWSVEVLPNKEIKPVTVDYLPMTYCSTRYRDLGRKKSRRVVSNPLHELLCALRGRPAYRSALRNLCTDERWLELEPHVRLSEHDFFDEPAGLSREERRAWFEKLAKERKKAAQRQGMEGRMFARLYNAFWRRVEPLLDGEALRLARSAPVPAASRDHVQHLYNLLVRRPELKDLARVCRPALLLLRVRYDGRGEPPEIPRGMKLPEILQTLVTWRYGGEADQVTPAFVKWCKLAKVSPSMCNPECTSDTLLNILRFGADVDVNRLAQLKGQKQWYTFHAVVAACPQLIPAFLKDPKRNTGRLLGYRPSNHGTFSTVKRACQQIQDALYGIQEPPTSMQRLLDLARDYHAHHGDRRRGGHVFVDPNPVDPHAVFPEPPFPAFADKRYEMVPLRTPKDLRAESEAMHHCVGYGSYDRRCLDGKSVIYSIRKDSKPYATLEITGSGLSWQVNQLYGYENAIMPRDLHDWVQKRLKPQTQLLKKAA